MKFSIEYNSEDNDISVLNIELDTNFYQLYVGNDAHIHLVENSSKEYISSSDLCDCIDNINLLGNLSDEKRAYAQNIIIYGSLYELLLKAKIYEKFDDIEMRFLNVFIYRGLDYQCIRYIQQCDYHQLYLEVIAKENNFSKEDLDIKLTSINLDDFPSGKIYFSEELQRVYLITDTYNIYFDCSNYPDKKCFLSCFIYILLIYYYPNDALFLQSL